MARLPDLAFGNSDAKVSHGGGVAADAMARAMPCMRYLNGDRSPDFATKVVTRSIGDVGIMASAVSAVQMQLDESQGWHLIVPFFGTSRITSERSSMVLQPGMNAALLPNVRRFIDNSKRSVVVANLQIGRLQATADTLAGLETKSLAIDERPQELGLRRQRDMFPSFQHICGLIDATTANPRFAEMLGVDDLLYRWTAQALGLLSPGEQDTPGKTEFQRLDVVCDLVRTAHDRPYTLTEMAAISGLSARALQYGFKSRFGCSPMDWQRRERIQMARKRLMFGMPGETITEIAYAMGFASSAAFSTQYKRHFGETPSQTIALRD